jgi:hypothetical protein
VDLFGCWAKIFHKTLKINEIGGDGGIRTLDRALQPYNGLANRRLQPLGHVSTPADMPDAAASRKRLDFERSGGSWPAVCRFYGTDFFRQIPQVFPK